MYGKKVKLRLTFLTVLILSLGLTIYLVLVSLKENVVYFLSPTEIKALSELKKEYDDLEESNWIVILYYNKSFCTIVTSPEPYCI